MPSKIETSLSPEQLQDFFRRCAQMKGGTLLKNIQALADEFGVDISLMSARSFKQGAFAEYLEELKSARQMAEDVTALVKDGTELGAAAAAAFGKKVFDRAMKIDVDEIGTKEGNNVSLAIARLQSGEQRSAYLEAKLREIEQKLEIQQFDAAAAVLEHAKEIKLVIADTKLDGAAKADRVRKILFGEKPADFKPVDTRGEQKE